MRTSAAVRVLFVAMVAGLLVTGCERSVAVGGAGQAPLDPTAAAATPVVASPPPTAAGATPADEAGGVRFVAVVRGGMPEVATGRTDAELAAVGAAACEGLRAGSDREKVVATARSLNTLDAEAVDEATARELIKLAIDTMCFDQAPRVDEFRAL